MSKWKRIIESSISNIVRRLSVLEMKQDTDSHRTMSLEYAEIAFDHRLRQVERLTARPSAATRLRNARRRRPPRM